jgi:hypothetical protein
MRRAFLFLLCAAFLIVCACFATSSQSDGSKVRLKLVDAATGKPLAGIVRAYGKGSAKPLELPGLFSRLRGLQLAQEHQGWHVVPAAGVEVPLPRGPIILEALAGLETNRARLEIDLKKPTEDVAVKLKFLFRPEKQNLVPGNTHLHLMKLSAEDADRYLKEIPIADGLRVMFISYLERHKDDAFYITNRYPIGPLPRFDATGVLFNNGEEHRHNFKAYGEGYGHVMFLNIKELVKPVSLGPGITGAGLDDRPLRPGIDAARGQGGTVIWCHNTFGYEDVPTALAGRLDAFNVFDGSRRGSYEDNYYRYLNVGLRLPISTGTDWFVYDFARVYAEVPGKLTIAAWLDAVKAGRCQVTNGPLLSLKVDDREPGDTVKLDQPRSVKIEATALGRHDFQSLQLIHNGKVIRKIASTGRSPFQGELIHELRLDTPGWLAARIESSAKNELGQTLFAHTSPIYVDFAGRRIADPEAALALLKQLEESRAAIRAEGAFSNDEAANRILALYDDAAKELRQRSKRPK